MTRLVLLLIATFCMAGCYYAQAVRGQWELTRKREPIADVLQDEMTPAELATRLRLVQQARQFAINELGLPDNPTYRSYADIERDYVVWNVFAAPEFSLQAKTWCFPVAGCVGYRGYFAEEDAQREAQRLARKGFDVAVGGVTAYSTLGKLNDPVLSSMMRWDDVQLVAVLFHELAHQVLYVKGDTQFNESFATAVEEFGVDRWLRARGLEDELERYAATRRLRQDLMGLAAAARVDLEAVYAAPVGDEARRQRKAQRMEDLADAMSQRLQQDGREPADWHLGGLNNARLVSMSLYEGRLPEFRALLYDCGQRLDCFYAAARALAER